MTYEENLRKVAEELKGILTKPGIYDNIPSGGIDKAARIAVRMQAEAIRNTIRIGFNPMVAEEIISIHLIERGLIPAAVRKCFVCDEEVTDKTRCHDCGQGLFEDQDINSPSNEQK